MRTVLALLGLTLAYLLYQYWLADDGVREVWRLQQAVTAQRDINDQLHERNRELEAEVVDLKQGRDAIEERARAELGMKRSNETFYQVVEPPGPD
ncbi:MAG: cell division protein FtsB [Gammaproteobacteria bacterium]|nr:cell division protein FtsB [Gammaproteobacteria bacterium]NND58656.1 cell division protein FtsB [Gammaproteobacteria bacterium]